MVMPQLVGPVRVGYRRAPSERQTWMVDLQKRVDGGRRLQDLIDMHPDSGQGLEGMNYKMRGPLLI